MSLFKCKMCGGSLEVNAGESVVTCEYCGTQQTLPKLDDEKRANMYDRANHFRRNNEFDKAMAIYEQILNEDKTDAEAYWSIVLCRYGIEYVEDPSSHRRIPTINRAQYTSILADEDYKSALANADTYQKSIYEIEAKAIDEIQKGILSISSKEEPFDVFICYKETDNNGRRTPDSVLAQELYYGLKNEGFKVFFARISLEDKLGSAYEPYIFAALNSAKVMVVLGTKSEFFNAVWVKNEWSRYLALIKQGQKKMLIPAYKDMDPYDLPEEFSHLQAQDMSKLGFMQDLIRGIKKIAGKEKKEPVKETVIVNQINQDHDTAPMLKRAFLFLEDGDFDSADEYAEKVLDIDPECSDAYIIKLLIDLKLRSASQISSYATPIDRNTNYIKALRFAKGDARNKIEGYNQAIVERIDLENKKQQYATACSLMSSRKYDEAIAAFSKIKTFKDSIDKIEACKQNKETDRKEAIYATALRDVASSSADDKAIKKSIAALETIKGYKDANTHIEKLQVRLEKWYEDKKEADERARIKAEQDKLEAARQAELRKIKAEQNKKKAIRIAKIGIPSLIALVLVVILTVTLFIPMIRFNKADKLFAAGKYDEANRIYSELDGFGDSEKRISTVKAIDQIEDKKLEDGIKTLLAAGVPVELTYQTEGGSLTETQTLMVGYTLSLGTSVAPLSAETVTTISEQNVFTFNASADFTGLKIPSRNGYRFLEWVLDTYAYDVEAKDAKFCLTLKATWSTKDYVVKYDLAGGSISKSNVAEYDPEDESFALINPTRIGYTFAGWTGTDLPGPTMEVTVPTGSYGDRNYTATWTANEYIVTYDAAGGTVPSSTQTVAYDSDVEYLIPERLGYAFLGWYENATKHENEKWTRTSDITLVAKWEIVEYTIGYEMNGGTNHIDNPSNYQVDTDTITLKYPSRTGYNFIGWTYEGETTPIKDVTIEKGSVGNKTFTANWKAITTTVKFNAAGGECETTSLSATYDQNITLPTVTRKGYTFLGWYNGSTKYQSGIWKTYTDIELTAKWQIISYSISYSLGGGTNSSANPRTYTVEQAITLKEPTRTGYTFLGWTYEGQTTPTKNVTIAKGSTGEKSYTANWEAISSTITLNPNGGACDPITIPVTYDEKFTLPNCVWDGHTFSGWYLGDTKVTSGTCKFYEDTTLVAEWNIVQYTIAYTMNGGTNAVSNPTKYNYHDTFTLEDPTKTGYTFLGWTFSGQSTPTKNVTVVVGTTGDKTYTANWQANTHIVTFDANGGTVSPTSKDVTFDTNVALPTPTRTGYTFGGWFIGAKQYTTGKWTTDSDVTLVAKWTANSYNVTYNANGGSVSSSYKNYTYDTSYTLLEPERTGYEFLGWYKDGTLVPSTGTWKFDTNISLVAEWKACVYTVTYDAGVGTSSEPSAQATYDSNFTLATAERVGYKFDGWYYNGTKYESGTWKTTKNITLTAKWTARTDIEYVVNHHQQNANDDGYTIVDTEKLKGTADATIKPSVKTYTHFISPPAKTVTIAPDGSLVVDYYYDRVTYDLTYVTNGGETIEKQTYKYDQTLVVATPVRDEYTFGGWFTDKTLSTAYSATATLNADTTIYAYWAEENKPTDFMYSGTSAITVSAYNGTSTTMWIPAYIGGVPVTTITESAFKDQATLLKVVVPDTVTSIGLGAFKGCNAIEDITLPFIGKSADATYYDAVLGYIFGYRRLNGNSSSGKEGVFQNKQYGTKPEGTVWQYSCRVTDGGSWYDRSFYYYIPTTIKNVTITSQTSIPTAAFNNCNFIETITIPTTVTSIGDYAFQNCTALKRLNSTTDGLFNIPEDVTEIKQYAFKGCDEMTKVTIPKGVTSIGAYAFNSCAQLANVEFATGCKLETIGDYAFADCISPSEMQLPTTVTSIGNYAFSGCISIAKINSNIDGEMLLPANITTIGEYAFQNLELMTKVVIPDTVMNIGLGAFKGCNAIEDITLPFIGKSTDATYYDAVLGYIFGYRRLSGNSASGKEGVFQNKQYGTKPEGTVWQYSCTLTDSGSWCDRSFYYYIPTTIKNVTITSQTSIPTAAFNNCNFIETITIPTTVTSIGDCAFQNCSATVNQTYVPTLSYWNGTDISTSFLGSGTEFDPYQINSAADIAYLASSVNAGTNYAGKYFVLNVDINLNGKSWIPIGTKSAPFAGIFDGNGKKISNLSVTIDTAYAGLLGYVSGTVKNLGITSGTIATKSTAASTYAGTLVGYLAGTVENCYSSANVTISVTNIVYAGGLIGLVDSAATVTDTYASGNVSVTTTSGFAYAGGFVGSNKGTIEGSLAFGNVTAKGANDSYSRNGGFAATNSGTLTECYRSESQILTKYTTSGSAYCDDGTIASVEQILTYAQANWNTSIWEYDLKYPNHK